VNSWVPSASYSPSLAADGNPAGAFGERIRANVGSDAIDASDEYDSTMTTEQSGPAGKVSSADIRREERGSSGGRWMVVVDGHEAEMTYSRASAALIIIDHTEVPDTLRGRGVGQALVRRAVEDARREGFRIIPLCPFAKAQFERHAEWRDVLSG